MAVLRLWALSVLAVCVLVTSPAFAQNSDASSIDYSSLQPDTLLDLAENGDPAGQWYYAMTLLGEGASEADEQLAYSWVLKSANQGFINGIISKAVMLATGQGTAQNDRLAYETYEIAARMNHGHGFRGIGAMHCTDTAPEGNAFAEYDQGDVCVAALLVGALMGDNGSAGLLETVFEIETEMQVRELFEKTTTLRAKLQDQYDVVIQGQ